MKKMVKCVWGMIVISLAFFWSGSGLLYAGVVVDHTAVAAFDTLPDGAFDTIRARFRIYYGHTSHGSQLLSGMEMLAAERPDAFRLPIILEDDWIDLGDEAWEALTRATLQENPETNVVMWSWCGQLSWMSPEEVQTYLIRMSRLEADFPRVVFVYMTGHLDGTGPSGTLYANNNRIRDFCRANGKVLYDFADIESYDPSGTYFPYASDACEWCSAWCAVHPCPSCGACAHSHCFNCYNKGKALWWLLTWLVREGRVAGGASPVSSPTLPPRDKEKGMAPAARKMGDPINSYEEW